MRHVLSRNARPVVLDGECGLSVVPGRLDAHDGPRRRVPQGVLDQGAADLEDALLVTEGRNLAVDGELERVLTAAGDRLELLEQQLGDPPEIDWSALEVQMAGIEPGEIEELLSELRQALDLLTHADEELAS